ncbi:carotenoid biosynthesis protein [Halocola ammonii]
MDLLLKNQINLKRFASIVVLWAFQVAALIGISLGYFEWFISKTELNLMIIAVLLAINFPVNSLKRIGFFVAIFMSGFFLEWLGVNYGLFFGDYAYGENLGYKLGGVPLLIGINWAVLIMSCAAIVDRLKVHYLFKSIIGAGLMVLLDFFIELPAPVFDFWEFEGGEAPIDNYVAWYLISFFMILGYQKLKVKGDFIFSCHLYTAQLIFFAFFYVAYSL